MFIGSIAAPLYMCSICIYYVIITYKRGEEDADNFIKGKTIEWRLHAVPIGTSLTGVILISLSHVFHPSMTYCYIAAEPLCKDLWCEDSYEIAQSMFYLFSACPYLVLPCVIFTSMKLMHRAVRAKEEKRLQFGISALRLRHGNDVIDHDIVADFVGDDAGKDSKVNNTWLSEISKRGASSNSGDTSRSNHDHRLSHEVTGRDLAFSMAYVLTYFFSIVISIMGLAGVEDVGPAPNILARIFFPLQGFFNFLLVFMFPRMVEFKRANHFGGDEEISWYRAFGKAVCSRGPQGVATCSFSSLDDYNLLSSCFRLFQ